MIGLLANHMYFSALRHQAGAHLTAARMGQMQLIDAAQPGGSIQDTMRFASLGKELDMMAAKAQIDMAIANAATDESNIKALKEEIKRAFSNPFMSP